MIDDLFKYFNFVRIKSYFNHFYCFIEVKLNIEIKSVQVGKELKTKNESS